ncbi:Conserved_hypothetical protein [Hexamita inflata]|uniref:Uncharacterized protein n=1 Tax=Hexamita inflata TaxID=28002 RepID=A0ABP1GP77_9EUKA
MSDENIQEESSSQSYISQISSNNYQIQDDKMEITEGESSLYSDESEETQPKFQIGEIFQLLKEQYAIINISADTYLFIKDKWYYLINKQQQVLGVERYKFEEQPIKSLKYDDKNYILTNNQIIEVKLTDKIIEGNKQIKYQLIQTHKFIYAQDFYISNGSFYINDDGKLFIQNNSKYKMIDYTSKISFQYCQNIYQVDKLDFDNNFNILFHLENNNTNRIIKQYQSCKLILQCDAILVLQNESNALELFDMINEKIVTSKINIEQIDDILELGITGLKLKDNILKEYFGEKYPQETLNHYNEFQKFQSFNTNQQLKILDKCQLMHVFKPFMFIDLYTVIEDNNLFIIDQEMNILKQISINCEIYSGYIKEEQNANESIIFEGFFHQLILCKGVLYIQVCDQIFKLQDKQFVFVFEIPDFNRINVHAYYSSLYSTENELFVKNKYDTFVFNDLHNQLKYYQTLDFFMCMFQNQQIVYSYMWEYDDTGYLTNINIFELGVDEPIYHVKKVDQILYFNNGVFVAQLKNKKPVIIDIYNRKMVDFEEEPKMLQHLVLDNCGLNLKREIIEKYFGASFLQQQTEYYNKLITQQMQFPCYLEEIYKIIPFNLILEQFKKQFVVKSDQMREKINEFKIYKYFKPNQINKLIQNQERMVTSFQKLLDFETDQ